MLDFVFISILLITANAWNNGLALTPPMGWNTYNYYKANINASLFINAVNIFTSTPLKSVGYEYITSGSGWWLEQNGVITRNSSGFMTLKKLLDL